ncbi:MAG: tRNA (uridine(34)/cytosine(34)/5-carboxymethylaminomethyluridine(34)-2'-O)-methyltransferase TrmL [Gammaproteobacteria bacterium]|nr:tRNA (uridine(34)/cytosine(34)/5-carboxymethylaminomethyluridine(34)-2'-O)-methyltransferase TrmL [Gammaproteobacteria bacterium]
MFHVVLFEPEIPPNTGNIIRLCANSGAQLHLIKPLGFSPTDSKLKRAGLDYHDWASVQQHDNLDAFKETVRPLRLFAISTRGTRNYADVSYQPDDALLFGPETRGLPQTVLDALPKDHILRIPMQPHNRSLNLSNAVAVVLYEAWRQQNFAGAD